MARIRPRGFTLTEMLIVVMTLGILTATALPTMQTLIESKQVAGAADALQTVLEFARSESVKQMRPMVVTYATNGTTNWHAGIRDTETCDPTILEVTDPEACSIPVGDERIRKVIDHSAFPSVTARANREFTRFEPVRATAAGSNVTVAFSSSLGKEVRVIVAPIGRIRSCSPDGVAHVSGFATCQ
jgi:type IV fimbrial biogenesis protein FimT